MMAINIPAISALLWMPTSVWIEELSSTDHRTSEEALGSAGGRKRTWNRPASANGEACERGLATDRARKRHRLVSEIA